MNLNDSLKVFQYFFKNLTLDIKYQIRVIWKDVFWMSGNAVHHGRKCTATGTGSRCSKEATNAFA